MLNEEIKINTGDVIDGVLLVTLSALSYAIYVLLSKKVIDSIGSVWFTAIAMSVSSVIILVYYALFFSSEQLSISYYAWVWVFLLALFSTIIPSFVISEALYRIGTTKTSIVGTLGPVITVMLAVFTLDEVFGFYHFFGMILVVFGVASLTLKK